MKTLTIVIPAYNAEKYLRRCLDSFIDIKNLNDVEVLIVNDGSKDNTESIANEYCLKYPDSIKLINKENGNVGSVYNVSIKEASGKYYKELDADDWVDGNGLERLIEYLKESDADIVYNNYDTVNEDGELIKQYKCIKNELYEKLLNVDEYVDYIIPAMHSTTYKTSLLKELNVKFDEKCFYVDTEYNLFPLMNVNNFVGLDYVVYKYLIGTAEQSVNINNFIKNVNQHKTILISSIDYYDKYLKDTYFEKVAFDVLLNVTSTHFLICLSMDDNQIGKQYIDELINTIKNEYPSFYDKLSKQDRKGIKYSLWLHNHNYLFYNIVSKIVKVSMR